MKNQTATAASGVDSSALEQEFSEKSLKMADGLENVMTGMGTSADKVGYNSWNHSGLNFNHVALSARYREDWLSQKIVDIVPTDATREWRHFNNNKPAQEADKEQRLQHIVAEAMKWARLYGTAYIVLDLKGTGPLSSPLNLKNLRKGCIRSLQVVDRVRLVPMGVVNTTPMSTQYGMPEHYQFVGSPEPIHHTRLIRFEGTELPLYELMRNQYLSDSTLIPFMKTIDSFHMAAGAAANLCVESNVDVVSIEGLQDLISNPEGEVALMKRFRIMKQMKSVYNVLLLDSLEQYQPKSVALTGLQNLIWEYLQIVAAAVGIPATRFLATQPKGLNASGDADISNYVDLIKGIQDADLCPRLTILDRIVQAHYGLPEWSYDWNDIFPESSAQKQARIKTTCDAVANLVETGTITPEAAIAVLEGMEVFGDIKLGKAPAFLPSVKPPPQGKTNGTDTKTP